MVSPGKVLGVISPVVIRKNLLDKRPDSNCLSVQLLAYTNGLCAKCIDVSVELFVRFHASLSVQTYIYRHMSYQYELVPDYR